MGSEVTLDSLNSGEHFEKLTLDMCISSTGLWGRRTCRFPSSRLEPQWLTVLSGQPCLNTGSD